MAEVAVAHQVDRSTVLRIRQVAKEGALAALPGHGRERGRRPGTRSRRRPEQISPRFGVTVKEQAVKLMLIQGKRGWDKWPGPSPGRRGHQERAARVARGGGGRRLVYRPRSAGSGAKSGPRAPLG